MSSDELSPQDRAMVDRAVERMRDIELRRLIDQMPKGYTVVETGSVPPWLIRVSQDFLPFEVYRKKES